MVIGVTTMVVSLATVILGLYYVNCETVNILMQVKLSEVSIKVWFKCINRLATKYSSKRQKA